MTLKKKSFLNLTKSQINFTVLFQKLLTLKPIFFHRRLQFFFIVKSNKFFLSGPRGEYLWLNALYNIKTIFRISIFLNFSKFFLFKVSFLCFDASFEKFIQHTAASLNAFCITGKWFNGFFSRYFYRRLQVLKQFKHINVNKYTFFFPDIAVLIGEFENLFHSFNEIAMLNIPILTISDLLFPIKKINYFLLCDINRIRNVYFYVRFIIFLFKLIK
jgi:hypothetical protein